MPKTAAPRNAPDRHSAQESKGARPEREWFDVADRYSQFVRSERRQPRRSVGPFEERSLAVWWGTQERAEAAGRLSPNRIVVLEQLRRERWPLASAEAIDRWEERLSELAAFVAEHGRNPSGYRPAEQRLFGWLVNQRHPDAALSEEEILRRHARLDEMVPSWRPADRREMWDQRCEELRIFVERYGRLPTRGDDEEAAPGLARWIESQRRAAAGSVRRRGWSDERQQKLDAAVPGWDTTVEERLDAAFEATLQELRELIDSHGVRPWPGDLPKVRHLSAWLGRLRSDPLLPPDRVAALDDVCPGWRDPLPAWSVRLQELADFVNHTRRLPTHSDIAARSTYCWLMNQRRRLPSSDDQRAKERRALLDERVPGWLGPLL